MNGDDIKNRKRVEMVDLNRYTESPDLAVARAFTSAYCGLSVTEFDLLVERISFSIGVKGFMRRLNAELGAHCQNRFQRRVVLDQIQWDVLEAMETLRGG